MKFNEIHVLHEHLLVQRVLHLLQRAGWSAWHCERGSRREAWEQRGPDSGKGGSRKARRGVIEWRNSGLEHKIFFVSHKTEGKKLNKKMSRRRFRDLSVFQKHMCLITNPSLIWLCYCTEGMFCLSGGAGSGEQRIFHESDPCFWRSSIQPA